MDKFPVLHIFDKDINYNGRIENYEYASFTRKEKTVGEFEITINNNKRYVDKLQADSIVMFGYDGTRSGVIKGRKCLEGDDGDFVDIAGKSLQDFCDRRLVVPPAADPYGWDRIATSAPETLYKHYIDAHLVNPEDTKRVIPHFTIATDQQRGSISAPWQARYVYLTTVLEEIADWTQTGYKVDLDYRNKVMVADIILGASKIRGQAGAVVFSSQFSNIEDIEYEENNMTVRNTGYAGGGGTDAERFVPVIPAEGETIQEGIERYEVFLDMANLGVDLEKITYEAQHRLANTPKIKTLRATINSEGPHRYKEHWDLGDTVTVHSKRFGVLMNARITEVKESWDESGYKLSVTFGKAKPYLDALFKRVNRKTAIL